MLLVLLMACDGEGDTHAGFVRTDAFFEAHPRGTAIAQASADGRRLAGVVGTRWHGADLAEWLAPCGTETDADVDAELVLEPGKSPWEVTGGTPGGGEARCVVARLGSFPFEEPSGRGEREVVRVRWRPGEAAEPYAEDTLRGGTDAAPRGLWSQAPPYWRVSLDGEPLWGAGFDAVHGRLLLPPVRGARVAEGTLGDAEAWARQLTCADVPDGGDGKPGPALDLVRVALGFEDGSLEVRETVPESACVAERISENRRWMRDRTLGATVLRDAPHAVVVLDVPVGAW